MKKLILAFASLTITASAFAATTTSSIPMHLEVAKQCSFSNVASALILNEDGSTTTAGYTVTCNTPYNIFTDNEKWHEGWYSYISNTQGERLKTGVETIALNDNTAVTLHAGIPLARPGYSVDDYVVNMSVSAPITPITRAGVYTDTYLVNVYY